MDPATSPLRLETLTTGNAVVDAPETETVQRSVPGHRKTALLVLVGYLLLAAYLSAPGLPDPLHKTLGGGRGDDAIFLWFLASTCRSVFHSHGHGLLITHALNYPAGVNAMWNTGLLPALLLAPLTALAGPGTSLVATPRGATFVGLVRLPMFGGLSQAHLSPLTCRAGLWLLTSSHGRTTR